LIAWRAPDGELVGSETKVNRRNFEYIMPRDVLNILAQPGYSRSHHLYSLREDIGQANTKEKPYWIIAKLGDDHHDAHQRLM